MNDATASRPGAYAQIRIREPAGERTFGERLTIGGEGADIVVPGSAAIDLTVERHSGEWHAALQDGSVRELRKHDVLAVGEAQLTVQEVSRTLLKLDIHHLVGNATIAPVSEVSVLDLESSDEDLEIRARPVTVAKPAIVAPDEARPLP